MAQNELLKRYLDAGLEFRDMTQSRAEALVKDLVKAGEVQADQARDAVADLIERSRKSSERLLDTVRTEVRAQITNLGLASMEDLDRLESRIAGLFGGATGPAKKAARRAPAKRSAAKKSAAKKSAAKKSAAKKATAKKSAAKKATAKRTAARKTAAKKTPTKRTAAKKSTAQRTAVKKTTAKRTAVKKTAAKKAPAKKRA